MEKVINITIGRVIFSIEEDAYRVLSGYLEEIRNYFAKEENSEEIMEDIEISIADKFLKRSRGGKEGVVLADVEKVIAQLGTVQDFAQGADFVEDEDAKETGRSKKLYRDVDDKIIAGVASGLGAYLGVEAVIVRLFFVLSLFLGGFGAVFYLILWLIVPEAKTSAQKFEMKGGKVTLKEIEKSLKEGIDKIKKKDFKKVENVLNRGFRVFGRVFLILLNFMRVALGVILSVSGVLGVFVVSFAVSYVISGADIPPLALQLHDFVTLSGALYWVFLLALYFTLLIPFIIFMIAGLSFLKKFNAFKSTLLFVLLTVWFIAVGFVSSVVFQNYDQIKDQVEQIQLEHR